MWPGEAWLGRQGKVGSGKEGKAGEKMNFEDTLLSKNQQQEVGRILDYLIDKMGEHATFANLESLCGHIVRLAKTLPIDRTIKFYPLDSVLDVPKHGTDSHIQ